MGVVDGYENNSLNITQRNYFTLNDELEILPPKSQPVSFKPTQMFNLSGEAVEIANHATEKLTIPYKIEFPKNSIIRRPVKE